MGSGAEGSSVQASSAKPCGCRASSCRPGHASISVRARPHGSASTCLEGVEIKQKRARGSGRTRNAHPDDIAGLMGSANARRLCEMSAAGSVCRLPSTPAVFGSGRPARGQSAPGPSARPAPGLRQGLPAGPQAQHPWVQLGGAGARVSSAPAISSCSQWPLPYQGKCSDTAPHRPSTTGRPRAQPEG